MASAHHECTILREKRVDVTRLLSQQQKAAHRLLVLFSENCMFVREGYDDYYYNTIHKLVLPTR